MEIDEGSAKTELGKNKEVFDAELWGISEALGVALKDTTLEKKNS